MKTAEEIYMQEQEKHPMQFGAYILPEQWQLDAMEAYAKSKLTMQEITPEELYELMCKNDLVILDSMDEVIESWTKESITDLLTDLKKLGYKIVK